MSLSRSFGGFFLPSPGAWGLSAFFGDDRRRTQPWRESCQARVPRKRPHGTEMAPRRFSHRIQLVTVTVSHRIRVRVSRSVQNTSVEKTLLPLIAKRVTRWRVWASSAPSCAMMLSRGKKEGAGQAEGQVSQEAAWGRGAFSPLSHLATHPFQSEKQPSLWEPLHVPFWSCLFSFHVIGELDRDANDGCV
jgi:hypothetical protein